MSQSVAVGNPFMLMLNPEVVLAAVEKSERLSQLNRHLCRPLDRATPSVASASDIERDDEPEDTTIDL
jgi:hypothetical protein